MHTSATPERGIGRPMYMSENQCSAKAKTTFETFWIISNVVFLKSYVSIPAYGTVFGVCGKVCSGDGNIHRVRALSFPLPYTQVSVCGRKPSGKHISVFMTHFKASSKHMQDEVSKTGTKTRDPHGPSYGRDARAHRICFISLSSFTIYFGFFPRVCGSVCQRLKRMESRPALAAPTMSVS